MIQEVNNIDRNGIVDRFMVWIVLLKFNFKENESKSKKYLPKFSLRFGIFAARICCKTSWTLNKN